MVEHQHRAIADIPVLQIVQPRIEDRLNPRLQRRVEGGIETAAAGVGNGGRVGTQSYNFV